MKLFVLTSDIQPTIFVKAESSEQAIRDFAVGFDTEDYVGYVQHPTFQCREVTMELLMELTPDEFQVIGDGSF